MANNVKGIDTTSVDPTVKKRIENANPNSTDASGILCEAMREGVPQYISAGCEKVLQGGNNSWLVFGRDRPGSRASGYGGKGHTHSGSIDICVGRMGRLAKERNEENERVMADPDFVRDSARIHISQKTDIDSNFNLCTGSIPRAKARSGIGIKADAIRVIGREGIKLVTRTDPQNSQNSDANSVYGVDLIAGNDDTILEPLVKGDKLVAALNQLVNHVDKLNGIVDNMLMIQMQFNAVLTCHFHQSPLFGLPTSPSIPVIPIGISTMVNHMLQTKMSLVMNKINLQTYRANYITSGHSEKWILSRYNNVN